MSLTNPKNVITEERLAEFYQQILPYLGGMPDVLANKFNRADLYSTDEKIIGRWTDGKPIYQKTITDILSSNTGNTDIDVSALGIDYVTDLRISVRNANTSIMILPYDSASGGLYGWYKPNSSSIRLSNSNSSFVSLPVIITLQYTKTSDSPVEIGNDTDYSTTEKIVGTWIDGKPLYQKTFVKNNMTIGTSWSYISTGLTGISDVVKIDGTFVTSEDAYSLSYGQTDKYYIALGTTANVDNIAIKSGGSKTGKCIVTIQYTKTTD